MRILMLIDSFTVGGAQRQFATIAKELHKDYDVTIIAYHGITSHFEEELIEDGIRIEKIFKKSRFDIKFIFRLLKFIREEKFSVSISFLDTPNFYNVLAKITRSVPKVIVSQRSAYFKDSLSLKKRLQESFLYFADDITTNSITQKERMEDIFPFFKGKVQYFPNVYNVTSLEVKNNFKRRFIVLANTQSNKNPLQLCKALVEYKKLYGTPKFLIKWYGRISQNLDDLSKLNEGMELLKENNLYNILTFKGITDQPFDKIRESDLLIHLSNFEGCPNSVCEAMALKTPVLVSKVCDTPLLLANGKGLMVDQLVPKDIAYALNKFENKTQTDIHRMTNEAHDFIKTKYSKKAVVKVLKNLLDGK